MPIVQRTAAEEEKSSGSRVSSPALLCVRERTALIHPAGIEASHRLRAQEYVMRRKWLRVEDLTSWGGEVDQYDDLATHFAVLDSATEPIAKATATVRFVKPLGEPLPLVTLFPELEARVAGACEVSRYISRTRSGSRCIRAVIVAHLLRNQIRGVAMVSPSLCRLLKRQSLVIHPLSDHPRLASMYGSQPQVVVEVDAAASASQPDNSRMVELALDQDWPAVVAAARHG